ncbi:MAG: sensor hybrid histidine kinase [Labilithrix sp.]|nr:sensor hybrid histidine kinase [Labilithrix sp.]
MARSEAQTGPASAEEVAESHACNDFVTRWFVPAAGALVFVIGTVHFASWLVGIPPRWSAAGGITMRTNMALAHMLAGAALVLLGGAEVMARRRAFGIVAAALVVLVGALTLAQYLMGVDLGIDQLIASESPGPGVVSPNRMGPPGALSLTLLGAGLLALAWQHRAANWLGTLASVVVLFPVVGFLYRVSPLHADPSTSAIALPAVIGLLALGSGIRLSERWRSGAQFRAGSGVRAEEAERAAAWRVHLLDLAHDAVFLWSPDRGIKTWNRGAEALYGYRSAEAMGRTAHELLRTAWPRPRTEIDEDLTRVGCWEGEIVHTTKAGAQVTVSARMQIIRGGDEKVQVLECDRDLTKAKRAEEALSASEAKFRSVFEEAAVGIARVSFDGARWLDVNDALCRMLGYRRDEMCGRPWPSMTHPADLELDMNPFRRMARGELDRYSVEKRFIHKEGHDVWARLTLSVVRDALGQPDYEVCIVEEITDRKRAEEMLRSLNEQLQEADRRKNQFLAMLSHELRNPLAPIRSGLYILDRATPGGQQAKRAMAVIDRQVNHLTRLVDELLDVTRISRGKIRLQRERLELRELTRHVADDHRALFASAGLQFDVATGEAPLYADGDSTRLAQVIGNLLTNAAKFTPRGGRVSLSLDSDDETAAIQVRDTGVGIAPLLLDKLFVPFTQGDATLDRSKGGLGLGLALVRGLVELHGGTVSVQSAGLGAGAEVTVKLPLEESDARVPEHGPVRLGSSAGQALRVLVIEDNLDAADSLKEAFELNGHRVETASTGLEGIAKARAFGPDVVLCDIGLPGIDGFEVARQLRADPVLGTTCGAERLRRSRGPRAFEGRRFRSTPGQAPRPRHARAYVGPGPVAGRQKDAAGAILSLRSLANVQR